MASYFYPSKFGDIHYLKKGLGDPLVLIHNIYPGADLQEFAHNIDSLARQHTVYAIDLLGFGQSAAPRLKYTADIYIDVISSFLTDVVKTPATVVSAGLTCAYVTEIAAADPTLFTSLAFICPRSEPTGLDSPRWLASLRRVFLSTPPFGSGFYQTMAGDAELALFLRNCFYSTKEITPELIQRLKENANRPGSVHPYASLVTGYLDKSLLAALPKVQTPILLVWGRHARPTPVEHGVRVVAVAKNVRLEIIEHAGAWPHYEQSALVNKIITEYLDSQPELSRPPATGS